MFTGRRLFDRSHLIERVGLNYHRDGRRKVLKIAAEVKVRIDKGHQTSTLRDRLRIASLMGSNIHKINQSDQITGHLAE